MRAWAGRLQKTGAVLMELCAVAHLVGHVMNDGAAARNEAEAKLVAAMTGYRIPEIGRTMQELMDGFSLTFSVMFAAMGMLAWSASSRGLVVITAAMLCECAIGLRYWFIAPNSFILTATICFVLSLLMRAKERTL